MRTRVSEGLNLAAPAKLAIATDVAAPADLGRVAATWNAQSNNSGANSKYVTSVLITTAGAAAAAPGANDGEITITYNDQVVGLANNANTLVLTPWIRSAAAGANPERLVAALNAGNTGVLDWSCQSSTSTTAAGRFGAAGTAGTVEARFTPAECR